jgi:hypothetical protein
MKFAFEINCFILLQLPRKLVGLLGYKIPYVKMTSPLFEKLSSLTVCGEL